MRVALLNQYFWPDRSAAGQMMADLAEDLAGAGASVTALAGRQSYTDGALFPPRETWQGVDIRRVAATAFGRASLWRRGADHAAFLAAATARLIGLPDLDVVLTATTPPLLPLAGLLRKRARGTRFVYWVHDLFPDAAIELGLLRRGSPPARALERASRAALEGADAVIAIGACMAERIAAKGVARERVHVVHNWADGAAIRPLSHQENRFRREHGLGGRFVVLYSGNMGRGHTFDALVAAARALRPREDVLFLFIGGGARRAEVERQARDLPNVRFLPYQPREDLPMSLGAADLAVVTLRDEALGVMVPSKLYGYMAAGRPILYVGPAASTVARVIAEAGCGAAFDGRDPAAIAGFIEQLAADRARAEALGRAARRAFGRFDRPRATAEIGRICRRLVA
ncbi:MAG TPA: glycosyltransferase family 4 protein [Kofleriaceae bacterium]|nr:glycosyltransferase family 4 protein [Kofleriaceae bacterium]